MLFTSSDLMYLSLVCYITNSIFQINFYWIYPD